MKVGAVLALAWVMTASQAQALEGTKVVSLHTAEGAALRIGTIDLIPIASGGARFSIQLDPAAFTDHFLSMKEFKCVGGTPELMCAVPYPYPSPSTVTDTDYAWLEHALLFMFKRPSDYGAKLWNGVYFQLSRTATGLRGVPQAVDLNYISAPPAKPDVPPYTRSLRDDYPADARWVRAITIE